MRFFLLFISFLLLTETAFGQKIPRFNPDTILTVILDSAVVITAQQRALNTEDFIQRITTDTSFFQAFKNIKNYNFIAENSIYTFDKNNNIEGSIYRKIRHHRNKNEQKVEYLEKKDSGKIYKKNGKYDLYTVQMFDYVFMNAYKSEFNSEMAKPENPDKKKPGSDGFYREKLKTLIFSPGKPVKGIPIISGKTEIFTANMRQYYDYTHYSGTYLDSIPVYYFKVTQQKDLSDWIKRGIMIKELTTIFDKRNMQILGRYIDMKLNNIAFSFDVQMNIEMSYFNEELLPAKISYQGNWDVPFKKPERASFLVLHSNYSK